MRTLSFVVMLAFIGLAPLARGAELNELLDKARACEKSEECVITTELACPLHCYVAVNKNADLGELRAYVEEIRRDIVCEACIEEDVVAVCEESVCVKSEPTADE